jgi:hypothetical protein
MLYIKPTAVAVCLLPGFALSPAACIQAQESFKITLDYQIQNDPEQSLTVTDQETISPWLTILKQSAAAARKRQNAVTANVRLRAPDDEDTEAVLGNIPPLRIRTEISADGTGTSIFSHDPLQKKVTIEGESGVIEWQGLQGKVIFTGDVIQPAMEFTLPGLDLTVDSPDPTESGTLNFKNVSFKATLNAQNEPETLDFKLPALNLTAEDGAITIRNMTISGNAKEAIPGLKEGQGSVRLESLKFDDKTEGLHSLEGVDISINAKLNPEKTMGYSVKFQVNKLLAPELMETDTPVSYHSEFTLSNLAAQPLAELANAARQMQTQGFSEEMIGMAMMSKFMELFPDLIAASPAIGLSDLKVQAAGGNLKGNISLRLDGSSPLDFEAPMAILAALSGDAAFTVDKPILEAVFRAQMKGAFGDGNGEESEQKMQAMVDKQIQSLVQENYLTADGDKYKMTATLKDGKFMLNGEEMSIPMF